jgi:hypothetical protein
MASIEEDLDVILKYHVGMIMTYAERNPVKELHDSYLGDPVFELFGLTDMSFAQKRWAAGFANSCATNLGRFTDKAAKVILRDAFNLTPEQLLKKVRIRSNDTVEIEETDGVILLNEIPRERRDRVGQIASQLVQRLPKPFDAGGIGFEFRGRYGKNDDTLIQKDEHMAQAIRGLTAVPVMGTFSVCNATGAIARLKRSWVIVSGADTVKLLADLTGFNLIDYLKSRAKMLAPVIALVKQA